MLKVSVTASAWDESSGTSSVEIPPPQAANVIAAMIDIAEIAGLFMLRHLHGPPAPDVAEL